MPSILELCQNYFQTKDLYQLFEIKRDSLEKDIKKGYYKLSLKVHPDRVPDEEKDIATEKFKILAKLYEVLTNKNKKELYDERGIIEDDDDEKLTTWLEAWRTLFKPITTEDIDNFKANYVGSELEKVDIKKAYLNGKGCINYMMNCVPFMGIEDEPRIATIVKELIDSDEVPEYQIFTEEPTAKKNRRHKKYAKESKEAEKIKEKLKKKDESLEQQIMKRQSDRSTSFSSFLDKLAEKYDNGDEDEEDDEIVSLEDIARYAKKEKLKNSSKKSNEKKKVPPKKEKERKVKGGRVSKRNK